VGEAYVAIIAAAVGAVATLLVSWSTACINRNVRKAQRKEIESQTWERGMTVEQALRREIEMLWAQLHVAQQKIFFLENFLRSQGFDPHEIAGYPQDEFMRRTVENDC
jgi:hypothetical protein